MAFSRIKTARVQYSTDTVSSPSDTNVHVEVRIERTKQWVVVSHDPSLSIPTPTPTPTPNPTPTPTPTILGQQSDLMYTRKFFVGQLVNLITIAECRAQLGTMRLSVLRVLTGEEFCESFIQHASNFVNVTAIRGWLDKPREIEILFEVELQHVIQVSMENVALPASASAVAALETHKFEKTCSICLDEFVTGVNVTRMPCSHVFHQNCIFSWLLMKNICPLCRFALPT